jgi:hypothetical protein
VADIGKVTLRMSRTTNQTKISVRTTGQFGPLNLSTVDYDFVVSPLLSADTAPHYVKAALLAAAAQIV